MPAMPQTPETYQNSDYVKYTRRLATESQHALAVRNDGTLIAWGQGNRGKNNIPAGLADVIAVASGQMHVLALKKDGTIATWGVNYAGQLDIPAGLQNIAAISAGALFSAALDKSGQVYAWGDNSNGQCDVPDGLGNVVDIQCGGDHVLALKADGTLTAWGGTDTFNDYDIPDGLNLFEDDPAPYSGPSPGIPQTPTEYAASNYARAAAKIAPVSGGVAVLNMDGTVKVVSVDQTDIDYTIPEGLADVTAIASSTNTLMALKADGTVVVWGYDGDYQSQVPEDLGKVIAIATGCYSSPYCLALEEDGTITAWGGQHLRPV